MKSFFLLLVTLLIPLSSLEVFAERIKSEGKQIISHEMSAAEACKKALRKAKERAIAQVSGEKLSSEDLLSCSDANTEQACSLNRHTWSMIDGSIEKTYKKIK